jgi:PncC family amidohydrolase
MRQFVAQKNPCAGHNSLYNKHMRPAEKLVTYLRQRRMSLALAESCTGGLLAHRITNVAGSSEVFFEGIIAYSNASKKRLLCVPESLIRAKGAVSEPTALAMAEGVRRAAGTTLGAAITGIAGPGGGSLRKPVGLTFIAVAAPQESICIQCRFKGDRLTIKRRAAEAALTLLCEFLE